MKPRTELWMTIAVCGIGALYFAWKAWIAEPDSKTLYIAFVIVSFIVGNRATADVRKKIEQEKKAAEPAAADDAERQGD